MLERGKLDRGMTELVDTESLVPQGHLMRKIDAVVDFGKLYEIVEPLYSEEEGRPSVDPVVLFKIVLLQHLYGMPSLRRTVNDNLKMSIFAETECNFLPDSTKVHTDLIHLFICRFEARQALIYQFVLGLTGESGKYNYSRDVHVYPPFSDIPCSAKSYKIDPALTSNDA